MTDELRETVARAIEQIDAHQSLLDGDEGFRGDDLASWERRVIADAAIAAARPAILEEAAKVAETQAEANAKARVDRADDELAFEFRGIGKVIAAAIRHIA